MSASLPALRSESGRETSSPSGAVEGGKGGDAAFPPSPPLPEPVPDDASVSIPAPIADDIYRPAPETNPAIWALQQAGLYVRWVGENEHRITCPWETEHLPGERAEARYYGPSDELPMGAFRCPCSHREKRKIGSLLDHLVVDRKEARCKPCIRSKLGELHRVTRAAETVLAKRGNFYRFNNMIVTLRTDASTGDLKTEPVTEAMLSMHLSAACDWEKFDHRSDEWRRCDVPPNVIAALLKSEGAGELPVLNRLARQPYFSRDNGWLIKRPGYDAESGTFAAFDPSAFDIPLATRENAEQALKRLQALLNEFEFANDVDRSTVISAILTASIRDYLEVAPGFNITASSPGSGKSYLASVIAPFAGPGEPRNLSYPGTNEEATKVVLSLAIEQPASVCFDDMPTDWLPHGAMNRMLTSGWISERKLGSNTVVTARASSFIMGTGNNIRPLRDMARRVASIYILPQVETAATRDYAGRPADEVRQNRGRYVSDALTIISAWRAAKCPKADVPNIAGFEQWSELCRHSLIWLGLPDPATSLIEQIAHDPDIEQLGDLLHAWRDTFGQRPTMVRQVLKYIEECKQDDLRDAIMELPCVERGQVNQSRFGRYLSRNRNRIVKGLQLVEAEHSERRAWKVVPISSQPQKQTLVPPDDGLNGIERIWLDTPPVGKSIPAPS